MKRKANDSTTDTQISHSSEMLFPGSELKNESVNCFLMKIDDWGYSVGADCAKVTSLTGCTGFLLNQDN